MELQTERKRLRRNRYEAATTTGVVRRTLNDARGIAEPLERYGELTSQQLTDLYNAIQGLPTDSGYLPDRLTQYFHESHGLLPSWQILIRPEYQKRHGYQHKIVYRPGEGAAHFLTTREIWTPEMIRWAHNSRIVIIPHDPLIEPSRHDAGASIVMSSLEVAIRRNPGHSYASHLDVIAHGPSAVREAASPLSFPVPKIQHVFEHANKPAELSDFFIKPDGLFGDIDAQDDARFYVLEYDRTSEDVYPEKGSSLKRATWLRKILAWSKVMEHPNPVYKSYLDIPNLMVLCLFQSDERMHHVMRRTRQYAKYPNAFLFKTIKPIDHLLNSDCIPQLYNEPWKTTKGEFNLATD